MNAANILRIFVLANILLALDAIGQTSDDRTLADQPEAQRIAVQKILQLGADWESPSKTVLIGFIGDKFTNETFALLAPLEELKHLAFFNVPADDSAFKHCKNLENVEWLQITGCKFDGTGLRYLLKCKKLRHVHIEETAISDAALAILVQHPSIETLTITHLEVPSKITAEGVRKLAALTNAEQIDIDMAEEPGDLEAEMKAALPKCDFSLHSWR